MKLDFKAAPDVTHTVKGVPVRSVIWNYEEDVYMGLVQNRLLPGKWNCAMWDEKGVFKNSRNPDLNIKVD